MVMSRATTRNGMVVSLDVMAYTAPARMFTCRQNASSALSRAGDHHGGRVLLIAKNNVPNGMYPAVVSLGAGWVCTDRSTARWILSSLIALTNSFAPLGLSVALVIVTHPHIRHQFGKFG